MKNLRFYLIACSLVLCLWLTAAFSVQSNTAAPLNEPTESAKADPSPTEIQAPAKNEQQKTQNRFVDDEDSEKVKISEPVALVE